MDFASTRRPLPEASNPAPSTANSIRSPKASWVPGAFEARRSTARTGAAIVTFARAFADAFGGAFADAVAGVFADAFGGAFAFTGASGDCDCSIELQDVGVPAVTPAELSLEFGFVQFDGNHGAWGHGSGHRKGQFNQGSAAGSQGCWIAHADPYKAVALVFAPGEVGREGTGLDGFEGHFAVGIAEGKVETRQAFGLVDRNRHDDGRAQIRVFHAGDLDGHREFARRDIGGETGLRRHASNRDVVRPRRRVRPVGIGHGQRDAEGSDAGVLVGRVLLGARSTVPKIPCPGADGRRGGGGLVRELHGERHVAPGGNTGEGGGRRDARHADQVRHGRRVRPIRIGHGQGERVYAGIKSDSATTDSATMACPKGRLWSGSADSGGREVPFVRIRADLPIGF